jgi:hypothetical protein
MSGPEDYGPIGIRDQRQPRVEPRVPIFLTGQGGKPARAERPYDVEPPPAPAPAVSLAKLERAVSAAQAAAEWSAGEPTRLQEIAELLLELPYGDFVLMTEGIMEESSEKSAELAKELHSWAMANVRRAGDAD